MLESLSLSPAVTCESLASSTVQKRFLLSDAWQQMPMRDLSAIDLWSHDESINQSCVELVMRH